MNPSNRILAFGGTDLEPWGDALFRALPRGPAVLLSFGVIEYGGPELVAKLRGAGVDRLARVDRAARPVEASQQTEFDTAAVVEALDGAGFLYLQGGNPRRIVEALAATRFWSTVLERRLPVVATSGGAMALGARCPDVGPGKSGWVDGLALVADALIAPHWDSFHVRDPKFREGFQTEAGLRRLFAIDDLAALELDGEQPRAHGAGSVQLRDREGWRTLTAG